MASVVDFLVMLDAVDDVTRKLQVCFVQMHGLGLVQRGIGVGRGRGGAVGRRLASWEAAQELEWGGLGQIL